MQYKGLYENVKEYFERDPLPQQGRGAVKVPEWTFPGNLRVERLLRTAERAVDVADKVVTHLPKSKRMRDLVTRVDRDKGRVDFVRRYSDLYGAYTEAEVIYTDDRTIELWGSLTPADRERFPFDAAAVDWRYYLQDVHCPAVTSGLRALSGRRVKPQVRIREREQLVLALFDMEGTILPSNVVESYVWSRMADLPWDQWPDELASVFSRIPSYLMADRRDRGEFLRTFFRRYEGATVEGIERLVEEIVSEFMLQKVSAAAVRRIRDHRAAGHRTMMITAAAEPFVQPLAPLFDEVIAARLEVRDGVYTGYLAEPPLVGEARGAWLRRYAELEGADLRVLVRLRGLALGPRAAAGGRQPGGGVARRGAAAGGQAPALADRGLADGRAGCPGCGSPSRRCADGVGSFRQACVPRAKPPPSPPGLPGPHP